MEFIMTVLCFSGITECSHQIKDSLTKRVFPRKKNFVKSKTIVYALPAFFHSKVKTGQATINTLHSWLLGAFKKSNSSATRNPQFQIKGFFIGGDCKVCSGCMDSLRHLPSKLATKYVCFSQILNLSRTSAATDSNNCLLF